MFDDISDNTHGTRPHSTPVENTYMATLYYQNLLVTPAVVVIVVWLS